MSTNACYGSFVFFSKKGKAKDVFCLRARSSFNKKTSTFIARFGEVRYESSARIADRLTI
jgi:hypothetical protein